MIIYNNYFREFNEREDDNNPIVKRERFYWNMRVKLTLLITVPSVEKNGAFRICHDLLQATNHKWRI